MPLDTSIPLSYRPAVQLDSPVEAQTKALTLRQLMAQSQEQDMRLQQAQQDQQQQRTLADLLRRNTGADGAVNHGAVLQGLAQAGAPKALFGYQNQQADAAKAGADLEHVKAQTGELGSKTKAQEFKLRIEKNNQALRDIGALQTPEEARASLLAHVNAGDIEPEKGLAIHRTIPQDPAQFARWKFGMLTRLMEAKDALAAQLPKLEKVDNGKQISFADVNPMSNPGGPQAVTKTTTPGEDSTAATAAAQRAQTERHFNTTRNDAMTQPVYMQTDSGLVALPKKLAPGQAPTGTQVMGSDGQPLQKPLNPIPAGVNTAIISNTQNLNNAKQALALLQGRPVGEMTGDQNATGWKGLLPGPILNRADPGGVDTRAAIADLGSMVLHDRSGAVVTASEYPRLQPFIPSATDDPQTAAKKLKRFIQVYEQEQQALSDTYSKDQGYRPSPVKPSMPATPPGARPPLSAFQR